MMSLESLWLWTFAISFIVLIAYLIGTWNHDFFSKRNIPSLKTVPFLGNMGPLVLRKASFAEHSQNIYNRLKGYKYGGMFEFMNPVLVLRDPELIKMVTVKDFEYFLDHRAPISEEAEPMFGKNLFNLRGHRWKEMRSTLSPAFTSSKMKNMFVLVSECGKQLGEFLMECSRDKKGDLLTVELKDLYTRYTNDVIATSAFGIGCDSLKNPKNEFFQMGKDVTNFGGIRQFIFLGYLFSPRLMKYLNLKFLSSKATEFFRFLVHNTMDTRKTKGIIRPDMIHLLMQAKEGTLKSEDKSILNYLYYVIEWDDDDLTAQAVLFFFAGFDTASTLLCFMSHLLATNPDVQKRLQDEIDQSLEENDGKLTYEAIHSMKYLDMVVSESLRLYPPAIFTDRKCVKNYRLPMEPSYTLEPGDAVWIPIYAIHHDPKYYPNPEKFDPERFSDENKDNIKPFTYLPFGSGPRNCIGK
ncbi:Cytochrome P450 9e2 [Blattella germanica]|nr:Cytochrome P450 9e2 [Blattella germanica]